MKVLKHGNCFKPKTPKSVTCEKCGCEFQYDEEDVEHFENRINAYESDDYYEVECPECGHYTSVSDPRICD